MGPAWLGGCARAPRALQPRPEIRSTRVYVHTCIEEGGYNNTRPLPSPLKDFSLRGPEHGMRPNAIAPISNGLSHPRTVRTAGIKSGWPIDWMAYSDGFRKSIGNRRFPAIVLDRRRVDGSRVLLTRSRREISYARCSNVFEVSVRA